MRRPRKSSPSSLGVVVRNAVDVAGTGGKVSESQQPSRRFGLLRKGESNLANSHEIGAGARGRIRRKASLVGTYLPSLSREAAVPNLMTRPHCSKETPRKGVTVGLVQLNRCRQPETAKHRRFGTTGVSEASRTSGRRGEYPHRIRVGRRSGLRRRETPSPLLLRSVRVKARPETNSRVTRVVHEFSVSSLASATVPQVFCVKAQGHQETAGTESTGTGLR